MTNQIDVLHHQYLAMNHQIQIQHKVPEEKISNLIKKMQILFNRTSLISVIMTKK